MSRQQLDAWVSALSEDRRRPAPGEVPAEHRRRLLEELLLERALDAEVASRRLAAGDAGTERLRALREGVLRDLVRRHRILRRVTVDDAELRLYYDAHPEEFDRGERLLLRHVFRRVDGSAEEVAAAARIEMEEIRAQLVAGGHFDDLARARSDSETARKGGLIGEVARGQLEPEVEAVVWRLAEGEISHAVETPAGFHVFRLDRRLPASRRDFDEVRGEIGRRLARDKAELLRRRLLDELLLLSGASYHPEALDPSWEPADALLFAVRLQDGKERRLTLGELGGGWERRSLAAQRLGSLERQLEDAVLEDLLLWEAQRAGLSARPEVVERSAQRERRALRELARETVRGEQLAKLDETVLVELYDSDRERFKAPREHRFRVVSRAFANPQQQVIAHRELRRLAARVRAGELAFADAARRFSEDPSRARGGDLGWARLDDVLAWVGPPAGKVLAELTVGELSEPLLIYRQAPGEMRFERVGYLLALLEEVRDPRLPSFAQARPQVVERYLEQRVEEVRRQVDEHLLTAIGAVVWEQNL